MIGKLKKFRDNTTGDYLYPITVSDAVYVDSTTSLKDKLQDLNTTMGKVLGSYVLDLEKWGLNNNSVDFNDVNIAKANSIGINATIQWASQKGYSEIIFPSGIYLIHEYIPIIPVSFMTINLNGAILRIRNNSYSHYNVIRISDDQVNVRITNGKIRGDRYDHTFPAGTGTHEGCVGISVGSHQVAKGSPKNIVLDNLEIYEHTGDSIAIATVPNVQNGFNLTVWEQGSIDAITGALIATTSKIRVVNKLMLNTVDMAKYGSFVIGGNSWGDFGTQINTQVYDIIFYNSSDVFVSSITAMEYFDDILIPVGASYAKIVLYQSNIPDTAVSDSVVLSMCVPLMPRYVIIENCHLHHSKRCGISGGGKYVYVRNCEINNISGTAPQSAIDIEDGYRLNQYQYMQDNDFHDCYAGISIVGTKHVFITGNVIDRIGISTIWDKSRNIMIDNNHIFRSTFDLQGETIFTKNTIYAGSILSRATQDCIVSDNYFHNSSLSVTKDLSFKVIIDNCRFYYDADAAKRLDSDRKGMFWYASQPQTISNCVFEGNSAAFAANNFDGGENAPQGWQLTNNKFINTPSVLLPVGDIKGCVFDNAGINLNFKTVQGRYVFSDCTFKNWVGSQFNLSDSVTDFNLLRFQNCQFLPNGDTKVVQLNYLKGKLEFINNDFVYNNATTIFNIIDFTLSTFTCKHLLIDGNKFSGNLALIDANLNGHPLANVIIYRNNILYTVVRSSTGTSTIYQSQNFANGVYTN